MLTVEEYLMPIIALYESDFLKSSAPTRWGGMICEVILYDNGKPDARAYELTATAIDGGSRTQIWNAANEYETANIIIATAAFNELVALIRANVETIQARQ